jgi:hypothetical protein
VRSIRVAGEANAGEQPLPARRRSRAIGKAKPAIAPPLERDVLRVVLLALRLHLKVSFVWRANTAAMPTADGKRFIRSGFPGCSDILGMLKSGRFLAVEVKRPGGGLSQEQHAFLAKVQRGGGCGFMATGVDDVMRELGAA